MKKKILTMIVGLMATMAVNAQSTYDTPPFGQGKIYVGASMSSFDIGSVMSKFHVDLSAKGGYMISDNILALGDLSYNYMKDSDGIFSIGAGLRVKAFGFGVAFAQPHTGATTMMFNFNTTIGELMR